MSYETQGTGYDSGASGHELQGRKRKSDRHSWSAPVRFQFKTERTCKFCDVTKVTVHQPGVRCWVEFWRGLEKINDRATPSCERIA